MKNSMLLWTLFYLMILIANSTQAQWKQCTNPYIPNVTKIALTQSSWFAGTNEGIIYRTIDNGATWVPIWYCGGSINALVVIGTTILASTSSASGIYISTNNGATWNINYIGGSDNYVTCLAAKETTIYAGSHLGIFYSLDGGWTWNRTNYSGLSASDITFMGGSIYDIYMACGSVKRSSDGGLTWNHISYNYFGSARVFAKNGNNIFVGCASEGLWLTSDAGNTWAQIALPNSNITAITITSNNEIFAGVTDIDWYTGKPSSGHVYRITNNGGIWTANNTDLEINAVWSLAHFGSIPIAGTSSGILGYAYALGWYQINTGLTGGVRSFSVRDPVLFVGTQGKGVIRSMDMGKTWTQTNFGYLDVRSMVNNETILFAAAYENGVYSTVNDGINWYQKSSGLSNKAVNVIAINGSTLFAATEGGVFISHDNGDIWTKNNEGLTDSTVRAFAFRGSNLFAGTKTGVFLSTNNGLNWYERNSGLPKSKILILATNESSVFACTSTGIFRSTNDGIDWVQSGLANSKVSSLLMFSGNIFAGTSDGIFVSTDNGTNWNSVNSGLQVNDITALTVFGTYIFAGTSYHGIWFRPLTEMITNIEERQDSILTPFELRQNFPNPFNQMTTISFSLPSEVHVNITVFDMLGRLIETLVDKTIIAGENSVVFDTKNLASGMYFYRMNAGNFVQSRKLLLLK